MKKASLAVLVSVSVLSTAAFAQVEQGIRETHDPQVAAEIEQHAQEAQSAQQETMPMTHSEHTRHYHHPMHHHHRRHEKQQ